MGAEEHTTQTDPFTRTHSLFLKYLELNGSLPLAMALTYAALLWTLQTPQTTSAVGSYMESSHAFRV